MSRRKKRIERRTWRISVTERKGRLVKKVYESGFFPQMWETKNLTERKWMKDKGRKWREEKRGKENCKI